MGDIDRLEKLKDSGELTAEEFLMIKNKLLENTQDTQSPRNESISKKELNEDKNIDSNNKVCTKCNNLILEGEKFCGKCGKVVKYDTSIKKINTNSDSDIITIKFSHIFVALLVIAIVCILYVSYVYKDDIIERFITPPPDWIVNVGEERVFNLDRDKVENEIKREIERKMEDSTIITKDFQGRWIEVYDVTNENYVSSTVHFRTEYRANLVSVEGAEDGKVKSITYLYATDSMDKTILDDIVSETLNSMGFTYELQKDQEFINKYLDISTYDKKDAVINTGKFWRTFAYEDEVNMIVSQYRKNGFLLPYAYDKTENGKYITIKCK